MLREARIILPYDTGDGEADRKAHTFLTEQLVKHFDGFTAHSGQGAWAKDAQTIVYDDVKIYDVAVDPDQSAARLHHMACEAGRMLKQDAVYIRYAGGDVEIAPLKPATEAQPAQEPWPESATIFPPSKRLPQVGDIWETRCGALVAVLSQASVLDGGFNVVSLTRGTTTRQPGTVNLVDLDGCVLRDHTPAAYDLIKFKSRFVDDDAAA